MQHSKTVAVMQPYFFPYAGYFRLLKAVDHFVIFDCVQFPRRGRVHRCRVPGPGERQEWLTLPIAHAPQAAVIRDLEFAANARTTLDSRLSRYPWLVEGNGPAAEELRDYLFGRLPDVVTFLEAGLRLTGRLLGLSPAISRSSELALPASVRGEDRVLAIVQAVGGRHYVNPPGGRHLYHRSLFERHGVKLSFLSPYDGPYTSLLSALMLLPPDIIRRDIVDTTLLDS